MISPQDFEGLEIGDQLELPPAMPKLWDAATALTVTQIDATSGRREFDIHVGTVYVGKCTAVAKEGTVLWA